MFEYLKTSNYALNIKVIGKNKETNSGKRKMAENKNKFEE